ncbi:POZ domain-containing protein [Trichodelitschia bisporula]|uniref:Elongin-C n=1 Tax=Trichodelitschia bisporula TaxID=703511 RepID=A0A6G1I071_9PEZI|nr:POZ domain-containing protein [Trichodelitschia bisporula]
MATADPDLDFDLDPEHDPILAGLQSSFVDPTTPKPKSKLNQSSLPTRSSPSKARSTPKTPATSGNGKERERERKSVSGGEEFITLVSSDGFEFVVRKKAALRSGTIRRMVDQGSGFREGVTGRCVMETISAVLLEKVCEYFYYAEKYAEAESVPDMELPPEICLEMLVVADFLDV